MSSLRFSSYGGSLLGHRRLGISSSSDCAREEHWISVFQVPCVDPGCLVRLYVDVVRRPFRHASVSALVTIILLVGLSSVIVRVFSVAVAEYLQFHDQRFHLCSMAKFAVPGADAQVLGISTVDVWNCSNKRGRRHNQSAVSRCFEDTALFSVHVSVTRLWCKLCDSRSLFRPIPVPFHDLSWSD